MLGSSTNDPLRALHSRPVVSPESCHAAYEHDPLALTLSACICVGLVLSYLPAYVRIVKHHNSDGYSPWFLLLGATSSASSLANIVTLQWGQVACCQYLSAGQCFESVLGIGQVFLQWAAFLTLFVLYLLYYPLSGKYVRSVPITTSALPSSHRRPKPFLSSLVPDFMRSTTPGNYVRAEPAAAGDSDAGDDSDSDGDDATTDGEGAFDPGSYILPGQLRRGEIILSSPYRHAVSLFALTILHLALTALTTFILLLTLPKAETPHPGAPPNPVPGHPGGGEGAGREHPSERAVRVWATTLGLVAVALGCAQYAPQLVLTARRRLVGSLSIPMMALQTPGSFVFVYTLAVRPGVNFSGWATYFVTGVLQGTLLVLCILFKRRQARLGVDDWGKSVGPDGARDGAAGERDALLRRGRR